MSLKLEKKGWIPLHLQLVPLLLKNCDSTSPLYINNLTCSKQNSSSLQLLSLPHSCSISQDRLWCSSSPNAICAYCPHSEKLTLQPLFAAWPIIVKDKKKNMRVSLGNQMLGPEWKLSFFIMKVKLKVISDILSVLVSFYIDKNSQIFK